MKREKKFFSSCFTRKKKKTAKKMNKSFLMGRYVSVRVYASVYMGVCFFFSNELSIRISCENKKMEGKRNISTYQQYIFQRRNSILTTQI